jgi:hypothetical protein
VPGEEDAAAYWTVLTDPINASGHTPAGNAYRFFLKRVSALHDAGELQVERLATTIGDRLSLVFVTVSEGERPHKIFESINATGVGLSQSDLLRNYLFMALAERSNSVYAQYWRPLERALGTEGLEGLVRDDLQSAGEFVRQNQVYRTARRQLEPRANDLDVLERHIKRLARRGAYYALFMQPTDPHGNAPALGLSKRALRHLAFLRTWGASTTYPLLLHLYDELDADRVSHEQAESCLEALESFIVRRYFAAVPTNVLNRLFIQLITALPAGEPIDTALRRELSRDGRWPDDELVRDGIGTVPYYSHGRAHQQRLVLQRLESHLRAEVDIDFDSADLSIEQHHAPDTQCRVESRAVRERARPAGDLRSPPAHARQPHPHRLELQTLQPAVRAKARDPQQLRAQAQRAAHQRDQLGCAGDRSTCRRALGRRQHALVSADPWRDHPARWL